MPISKNETRISVRVYPNAAGSEVVDFTDSVLRVRVSAPPLKGKANQELITLLSHVLGISKGSINIIKGQTRRIKVITIDGLRREEVKQRLSSYDGGASRLDHR